MTSRCHVRSLVAFAAAFCLPALVHAESMGVAWRDNLDAAKIEAAQSGRLLLLHFYTRTCAPCKVLDQNVLSQPQVGGAVERDYVPVKIDADSSPALANMYRIDRVPTEVVLTPQGEVVAVLSTPDNPDGYVAQLQNLAQHVRQAKPGAGPSPAAAVNSAYASLPPRGPATASAPATTGGAMGATAPAVPRQQQANPFVAAPPTAVASTSSVAPTMPSNAMPQSYRNPMFSAPPIATTAAGAAATSAAAAPPAARAVASAAVTPPPTNPAYAALGGAATAAAPTTITAATTPTTPAGTPSQVAAAPPVRPAQPPLPANCPPVAFDGCCPVTLKLLNKWEAGNTTFGAIHRGRTYLFAGEEQRQQFLASPDSFSPVFAGYDPVLLLDKQQTVPGTRKFGFRYGDAFYLFSCVETRDRFQASPQTYAAGVRQAMARVDGTAGGVLRR